MTARELVADIRAMMDVGTVEIETPWGQTAIVDGVRLDRTGVWVEYEFTASRVALVNGDTVPGFHIYPAEPTL